MTHNRETEYFCLEHGLPYPKEEISCPHCIREICEEHDKLMANENEGESCHWSCTGCSKCGSAGHGGSWF